MPTLILTVWLPRWTPPFYADEFGVYVLNADATGQRVLELRGWDALTGGGGLRLSGEEAMVVQQQRAVAIAEALNQAFADAPLETPADERRFLHELIQDFSAITDPEQYPYLCHRASFVLEPCDHAGHCVPLRKGYDAPRDIC